MRRGRAVASGSGGAPPPGPTPAHARGIAGPQDAPHAGGEAHPPGLPLEPLVLTVLALDAARADGLLEGLAGTLRPAARAMLARVGCLGRAERHAALLDAFAPGPATRLGADDLPGALGQALRRRLAPGDPGSGTAVSSAMERWARRLLLEAGVP